MTMGIQRREFAHVPIRSISPLPALPHLTSLAILLLGLSFLGLGCAGPLPDSEDLPARVEKAAEGIEDDPLIEARRAGVEAARAREERATPIDEVELRVGEVYVDDDHGVRVSARVPVKRPAELRAQRQVYRAETEIAVSRLEEASLERRAELCFPSVSALAHGERQRIYAGYASRQELLLAWNEEWRSSGTIDELRGARFELESKTHVATRKPLPMRIPDQILGSLPRVGAPPSQLVLDPDVLRRTVGQHHPSVGLRRATAARYRALAERAQARRMPWLRFFDVSYEHRSNRDEENGVGGRLAFSVPLGGRQNADLDRYRHLVQQESSEATAALNQQMEQGLGALVELQEFEADAAQYRELEELANRAERIADHWRQNRLAKPAAVAALLDEALAARTAVVDARERAAIAGCTLLAMTGVSAETWPR